MGAVSGECILYVGVVLVLDVLVALDLGLVLVSDELDVTTLDLSFVFLRFVCAACVVWGDLPGVRFIGRVFFL